MRLGDEDNFWSMGDGPGPCGPSSEIFYRQADTEAEAAGIPHDDLWLEIWNLVFMEQERLPLPSASEGLVGPDGRPLLGELRPLERRCVDTGMGLERLAAVLQGQKSNYGIDTFRRLIGATLDLLRTRDPEAARGLTVEDVLDFSSPKPGAIAVRVIMDHLRSSALLLAEGVRAGPTGRGYIVRRLIRRALCSGLCLSPNLREPLLSDLLPALQQSLGRAAGASPELDQRVTEVSRLLREEELLFLDTVRSGMGLFKSIARECRETGGGVIDGENAFRLYDTFGFPIDLCQSLAEQEGLRVDMDAFQSFMEEQQTLSRANWTGAEGLGGTTGKSTLPAELRLQWQSNPNIRNEFTGFQTLQEPETEILAAWKSPPPPSRTAGSGIPEESAVFQGWVVLSRNPFYAEGGGQVGDRGRLILSGGAAGDGGELGSLRVLDAQRVSDGCTALQVEGTAGVWELLETRVGQERTVGDSDRSRERTQGPITCRAEVESPRRSQIAVHHTATHMLNAALEQVAREALTTAATAGDGEGRTTNPEGRLVIQAGSLVNDEKLRFDCSVPRSLGSFSQAQLRRLEELVNQEALRGHPIHTQELPIQAALASGAVAEFGERYGTGTMRVVSVGAPVGEEGMSHFLLFFSACDFQCSISNRIMLCVSNRLL